MNNTQNLTERELLTDLLNTEKEMVKTYAGNITESAGHTLRQILTRHMTECAEDQLCIFEEMNRRNMYPTKQAPQQDTQTAKQTMQQLQSETW